MPAGSVTVSTQTEKAISVNYAIGFRLLLEKSMQGNVVYVNFGLTGPSRPREAKIANIDNKITSLRKITMNRSSNWKNIPFFPKQIL